MVITDGGREQAILDAAAELIIRHGYNKTTMSDVAEAVGLGRGLVYVHFKSKDDLLEALIAREMRKYGQLSIDHIEADARGGTIGSIHRSILYALKHTPFMAAIVTRDERTFGKYLRKPGNLFEALQSPTGTRDLLQALQEAGTVRQGVNISAMAFIMDVISTGLVGLSDIWPLSAAPPYDELMETVAEMLDRMLTPEDGGNIEAGKAVLRQLASTSGAHFERMKKQSEGSNPT